MWNALTFGFRGACERLLYSVNVADRICVCSVESTLLIDSVNKEFEFAENEREEWMKEMRSRKERIHSLFLSTLFKLCVWKQMSHHLCGARILMWPELAPFLLQ